MSITFYLIGILLHTFPIYTTKFFRYLWCQFESKVLLIKTFCCLFLSDSPIWCDIRAVLTSPSDYSQFVSRIFGSLSANTIKAYVGRLLRWQTFARSRGLPIFPARSGYFVGFLDFLWTNE